MVHLQPSLLLVPLLFLLHSCQDKERESQLQELRSEIEELKTDTLPVVVSPDTTRLLRENGQLSEQLNETKGFGLTPYHNEYAKNSYKWFDQAYKKVRNIADRF